ncbi:MAG: hypothetical protein JWQ63_511 [Mucilaginibacter sp.]|nr:hypothetical protein [Mucilaginibacter sp.]
MDLPVKNIDDLRLEIYRLKGLEEQQSFALRQRFNSPLAIFSTIFSLIPKSQGTNGLKSGGLFNIDIVQLMSSFLLPFTLNKTLFRRSNFLIKGLVRIVSRRASRFINEDSVSSIWDKVKSFIPDKIKSMIPDKNKDVAKPVVVSGPR